jgi:YrbI family 3-deoxy-D-manno-octulosonate 8-phosphate phosphatase
MSKVLAIIPARGGSKGITHKNVRPFLGKPLLGHSIEHALLAPSVNRIVVSTDDAEIAGVARRYGAEVVWRPAEISGDAASSESALVHVLDHLKTTESFEPDLVVFLQATSPLRRPGDVEAAIEMLGRERADSLFSGAPVHGFLWRKHEGKLSSVSMDYQNRPRRQDVGHDFIENGSIYIFKPWVLRELNNRLGGKIVLFPQDSLNIFQIDEPGDLNLIEELAAAKPAGAGHALLPAIRLLALDFDGVMTDNKVLVSEDGAESVWCHRGDGWGIAQLKKRGVKIIVISTEANRVVQARCRKLGLDFIQACSDKLPALRRVVEEHRLGPHQVAYVGNDVNDLECLQWVGLPIAVADSMPAVRAVAGLITSRPGGAGAVREVADWLIAQLPEPDPAAVRTQVTLFDTFASSQFQARDGSAEGV